MKLTKCLYYGCNSTMNPVDPSDHVYYVCSMHMPLVVSKFKELGEPGKGPSHMPGCMLGKAIFVYPEYLQQYFLLSNFAEITDIITTSTNSPLRVECWKTYCCHRSLRIMNLDGKIYALNIMQMQDSGIQDIL
jgi:hypothetical protein